jgi:hypothetical protein
MAQMRFAVFMARTMAGSGGKVKRAARADKHAKKLSKW